jgi:cytochrome c556
MKIITKWTAATVVASVAVAALAHGGATGIVKERMEDMTTMSNVVKTLSAMMQRDRAYDAAAVRAGADAIREISGAHLRDKFPVGSLQTASEAKDEIWTDWENFGRLADELELLAQGLAESADNGLMANETTSETMTMMGTNSTMMMGAAPPLPSTAELAAMPADGVFNMLVRTCSGCHTQFRKEKK